MKNSTLDSNGSIPGLLTARSDLLNAAEVEKVETAEQPEKIAEHTFRPLQVVSNPASLKETGNFEKMMCDGEGSHPAVQTGKFDRLSTNKKKQTLGMS